MWETFISWYLNYYLGKYIENLNAQQLAFALSKGELELEDVPLKRNIFRGWGLPIEVKSGVVGRIKIRFNIFNYFRNEPVLISIEDVYLVAEALDFSELNPMEERTLSQELKMSALDAFEGRWKAGFDLHQKDAESYYSYIYPSSLRIGGAIVTKVLENLQLNVTNVHIRFEGAMEGRTRGIYAFGMTLGSLSVESCDNQWTPLSLSRGSSSKTSNEKDSFKTLRTNRLGIYCDINGEEMSGLEVTELKEAMGKPVKSSCYILYPVSSEARVRKNNSPNPLYNLNKPRFDVFLSLEKVCFQLSESQYKLIFTMYKSLRKLARNVRLSHYRPTSPISNCPKAWWLYSVQAILSLRGFRRRRKLRSWKEVIERAKDNIAYVLMYYQHLLTEEFPSAETLKLKNRMELELHYEDLIVLRKIAMYKVEELGKRESSSLILVPRKDVSFTSTTSLQGAQKSSGLLSWIFPSWSQQDATPIPSTTKIASPEKLPVKAAESNTDFDEAVFGEVQAFGKDALLARFNFQLSTGSVLLNKRSGAFLELSFGGVSVDLSLKPRSGSHSFQIRLSSLLLKDAATKLTILSQHLTTTKEKTQKEASHDKQGIIDHLFHVFYQMKPHKKAGHLVRVATRPLDLTVFPKTCDEVRQFFQVRMSEEDDLEVADNGYERTREELAEHWERLLRPRGFEAGGDSRTAWDIQLDIFAPKLTLHGYPSTVTVTTTTSDKGRDTLKKDSSSSAAVILDFGRFKFSNLDTSFGKIPPDPLDANCSEEEEEFLTPCSSPVPEEEEDQTPLLTTTSSPRHSLTGSTSTLPTLPTLSIPGENLREIQAKFYKRYSLEISEVQILILTDGKEGVVTSRGKGPSFHSSQVVDKFSVNLQFERRMVCSEDPLWPAITLHGLLPSLTLHFNERKVASLRQVLDAFYSPQEEQGEGLSSFIRKIEMKCSSVSVCITDDCWDSDVPLLELSVSQLELYQNCIENSSTAEFSLSGDYFNRSLSGWEPFLEPWKARIQWKKNLLGQLDDCSPIGEFPSRAPGFEVYISSMRPLEVTITSSLLILYKTVSLNWNKDFDLQDQGIMMNEDKRRPFVPFTLRNETGSRLWFCTIISNNEEVFRQQQHGEMGYQSDATGWMEVAHGSTQSFSFEARGEVRHRSTHQVKTHQLAVRVEGWKEVTPVSVDRVGTYFRVAKPEFSSNRRFPGLMDLPPTRVVLEVSLHGTAQKVVTIRSALVIKNALPDPVKLKLENSIVYPSFERAQTGGSLIHQIPPGGTYPVPLHSVWAHLWIRPLIPENSYPLTYHYCSKALLAGTANQEGTRECVSRNSSEDPVPPYRFCVAVKRNDFPADCDNLVPANAMPNVTQLMSLAHRVNEIKLLPPFRLANLLPHDVSYEVRTGNGQAVFRGQIPPGKSVPMVHVDTSDHLEVLYQLDNFPKGLKIPLTPGGRKEEKWVQKVKVLDTMKRPLLLTVKVVRGDGGVVLVQLSCPCWVVNKSGLPLLCKQEGTSGEAAGQFQEHEVGRMVTPLMMSFPDTEGGSEKITLRVGSGLHKGSKTFWCRPFLAQVGLRVRKLTVSHCNNTPESVYMVGVEIKNGVGRYRETKLVIISPRFFVDNRSSLKIQISQKAYASSFFDAKAEKTHLSLPSGCNLPFHWPRLDKEQLLCVRIVPPGQGNVHVVGQDKQQWSAWSGGFPVDNVDAFHINIRDADGKCYFLRVEIVLQGPSYFIIFSDTTQLPPPFRVDNFSLVPLVFHQKFVAEERLKLTAKAESSVPYSLDESTMPPHLSVEAPGGTSVLVNMDDLRYFSQLTYENFFYIAFTATFSGDGPSSGALQGTFGTGMESLQLVLDVQGTKVILNKKENGKKSQLWRVSADGLIEHKGSSPPRDFKKRSSGSGVGPVLVLDIAGTAPIPSQCVPLMLRKPDRRRKSTQHWEFTVEGRLKCSVYDNLFVQAKDGFGTFGDAGKAARRRGSSWKLWSDVVLGPSQPVCYNRTDSGIPAEQAVSRQKLRPGSGILSLCVETDGPTRVLRIIDVEHPPRRYLMAHTFEENDCNTTPKCRVKVDLPSGFGVSIVACTPVREELLYGRFTGFFLEWTDTENSQILKASILNLQVDNQLFEAEKSSVIFIPSSESRSDTYYDLSSLLPSQGPPALSLFWEGMKSNLNARVFKVWELNAKPLSLIIEERLLLKLCSFLGLGTQVQNLDILQQSNFEVQKALASTTNWNTRRYYFAFLKTDLSHVKLSVLTSASKLSPELSALKRRLGLTLIRFEEATVELDPFVKAHPFETFEFLWALLIKHYRDELVSQAAVILGSTDFLGNPLGFVNDISEGVSLMIYEGSVAALVKNVAHGLSNSAAKVTGTLGEGLGKTILDDKHEAERRKIKEEGTGSSGGYLAAGLRGFGHGLIGGVTSLVAQSCEGASKEGFLGLVTGFSKGLVGTVTKPAVGVLDLATGAASAIRDSFKTSSKMTPRKLRPTRVAVGNGGLLPVYSEAAARAQELLYELNDRKYSELFIGCETLKSGGQGQESSLRIMISSENIIVFKPGKENPIVLKVPLKELIECQLAPPISPKDKTTYIELVRFVTYLQAPCKPQVICENEQVAKKVLQQINYAKVLYEELRHSRIGDEDDKENDNEDE